MTVTDFGASIIRTLVTVAIGAVITWLAKQGIEVDSASATVLFQTVATGLYYVAVRLLGKKFPKAEWALGFPVTPTYQK